MTTLRVLWEATIDKLKKQTIVGFPDTKKRQHATDTVHIKNVKYTPSEKSHTLKIVSNIVNVGHNYVATIMLPKVKYVDEIAEDSVDLEYTPGSHVYIVPVSMTKDDVQVKCTCLDFHFRFAPINFQNGSLYGSAPPPYVRKTTTRPEVNPLKTIGMCKHLIKMTDALKDINVLRN